MTSISVLLYVGSPTNISRFIVPIDIDAIQG